MKGYPGPHLYKTSTLCAYLVLLILLVRCFHTTFVRLTGLHIFTSILTGGPCVYLKDLTLQDFHYQQEWTILALLSKPRYQREEL